MSNRNSEISGTEQVINWRTVGVKRERQHEALISRLTLNNKSIFVYLKDLMVFAAMVGHDLKVKRQLKGETIEIILDTYASDQKDGFIYLLALIEKKDGLVLKDENLRQSVQIFEEYCNAGLYEITNWLDENPGDPIGIDTLLNKIFAKLVENDTQGSVDPNAIEVTLD